MSLNADVEEGLDSSTHADEVIDLIKPPVEKNGQLQEVDIVTDVNNREGQEPISEKALFGDIVEGELPNFQAEFALVENQRVHVIDLKDIESTITNQNTISREDACLVDSTFGGFLTDRLTVNQFTSMPSKTNLPFTKRFFTERVAKEEAQLLSQLGNFFDLPMAEMTQRKEFALNTYLPVAEDQIYTFQRQYEDVLKNIETSKNTIVPWGNVFINVLNVSVDTFTATDFKALGEQFSLDESLNNAIAALQSLLSGHLGQFIESVLKDGPCLCKVYVSPAQTTGLTLGDLVNLYRENRLQSSVCYLRDCIETTFTNYSNLHDEVQGLEQNFETVNDFIVKNTSDILATTHQFSQACVISKNLSLVNAAMQEVFTFLRFCL